MTRIPVKWTEGNLTSFLRSQVFWAAQALPEARRRELRKLRGAAQSKGSKGSQEKAQIGPPLSTSPIRIDTCFRMGLAHYEAAVDRLSPHSHIGRPVGLRARRKAANRIRTAISRLRSQINVLRLAKPTVEDVEVSIRVKVQIKVPISRKLAEFGKLGARPSPRMCLSFYLEGWVEGLERLAEKLEKQN